MSTSDPADGRAGRVIPFANSGPGRVVAAAGVILVTIAVLVGGFDFLQTTTAPKPVVVLAAILWGVGGIFLVYSVANWLVEQLPPAGARVFVPIVFVGPAVLLLAYFLVLPALRTGAASLFDHDGINFVGLANYVTVFTDRAMQQAFRNNLLWIAFGATLSVLVGLIVAALADRSRFESIAKAIIFMPMAISLVGPGLIWKFVYAVRDPQDPQIGLLNAIWVALGNAPRAWVAQDPPLNTLALIVVVIWLQTGFAMVLFSAAIKGVPAELLDAGRVDGANEIQVFTRIVIPSIMPTLITVTTTIVIFTLKIFDVVIVMTGGQFGTDVIATQFYREYFTNRDFGLGSAIAIVLLVLVSPVMVYNLRRFRQQQA